MSAAELFKAVDADRGGKLDRQEWSGSRAPSGRCEYGELLHLVSQCFKTVENG